MRGGDKTDGQSVTINIRAPRQQRDLIDRAAEMSGKSRTEFMLEASRRAAVDALLDQRVFFVDENTYRKVAAILDAPVQANPKLRGLLGTAAPWEK